MKEPLPARDKRRIIIMGAAGRDFHNFNLCFRDDPSVEVVAFTATQIPFIHERRYPPELAGPRYPEGIPIHPEDELPEIIRRYRADTVVFAYSDVSHEYVMHRASLVTAAGADFMILGADRTMLDSTRPVVSVCAVRTGCGKSAVSRFIAGVIKECGKRPVAIRHPMPYGDLVRQRVQRFASVGEMKEAGCTIEEMEEYEHLVKSGVVVYAGVDYAEVLKRAEEEADIIIWDGGNNDLPFIRPSLEVVVVDPMRPGHETSYYPGEANLRRAGCIVINKVNNARAADIEAVRTNVRTVNPTARVVETSSEVTVEDQDAVKGRNVLVIEDGPTLTHGGMTFGAGTIAARACGAVAVDPAPYAVGSIRETLRRYPALENLLPATGYSPSQIKELEETINATPAEVVLVATPVDLSDIVHINKPFVRVRYEVKDVSAPGLRGVVEDFLKGLE